MNIMVIYPDGGVPPYGRRTVTTAGDNWYFFTPKMLRESNQGYMGHTLDQIILMYGVQLDMETRKGIVPCFKGDDFIQWGEPEGGSYSHWGIIDRDPNRSL
jgi:hypothetical protein